MTTTSPWGPGFSFGFGPVGRIVSGHDPGLMQILGTAGGDTLLWDFSETQCFYLKRGSVLYLVSPKFASQWFTTGSTVYDPFFYSVPGTTSPSTLE